MSVELFSCMFSYPQYVVFSKELYEELKTTPDRSWEELLAMSQQCEGIYLNKVNVRASCVWLGYCRRWGYERFLEEHLLHLQCSYCM